jgi:hypothetical protein
MLDALAWPTREDLSAHGVLGRGLVEHNQTDVAQQQCRYVKVTDGAQSAVLLLSVDPRQQVGEQRIQDIQHVIGRCQLVRDQLTQMLRVANVVLVSTGLTPKPWP